MRNRPKLSIGIPVYNGERVIAELLMCLEAQTFKDFEIIICDNASRDRTQEICENYAKEDSRIRYYRNDVNIGLNRNFDKAFSLSQAELFKWAACDDLLEPIYLEKCVQVLQENPDAIGAQCLPKYVNAQRQPFTFDPDSGRYTDPSTGANVAADVDPTRGASRFAVVRFFDVLFNHGMGLKIYGVFRRNALECSRRFRPNFAMSDKAILLEMALLGRYVYVEENLFIKRFGVGGTAALSWGEIKKWLDPNSENYSRRLRAFLFYLSAPIGKPVDIFTKLACMSIVCAYGLIFVPIVGLRSIGILRTPVEVHVATLGTSPSWRTPES